MRQDPNDGDSAVTWDRKYPTGFVFFDVLRNREGKNFETRVSEMMSDGRWDRYILFSDPKTAPHGFVSPTQGQCVECHSQAGRSDYGGAAVPGGGGILSDPYQDLERGRTVQGGFGTRL